LLIVVAAVVIGGTWWYSQHQYYVGSDGSRVAVYKGIKGDVLGIHFSSEIERTAIPVSTLSSFERDKVNATISATSRRDADDIVANLTKGDSGPAPSLPAATSSAADNSPAGSP
jgi:protein phosphatase